jgi:hypothetical protein
MAVARCLVGDVPTPRVRWTDLGRRARAWRVVHASWSIAQLAALGDIWAGAVRRRWSRRRWASVAFLAAEGGALAVGHGNCPVGRHQAGWGDPVPFFELLLPPRAAKAAIPVLTVVSILGITALLVRHPGPAMRAQAT